MIRQCCITVIVEDGRFVLVNVDEWTCCGLAKVAVAPEPPELALILVYTPAPRPGGSSKRAYRGWLYGVARINHKRMIVLAGS